MIKEAQMDLLEILSKLFCGRQVSHRYADPRGNRFKVEAMKNKCKSLAFWFSSLKEKGTVYICVHENSVPIVGATALIFLGK